MPGDVSIARPVDPDAPANVEVRPAEEGRVDERRADRVQLRDEGIPTAVVGGVEGPGRGGEVARGRLPGDVGVAPGIDRDAAALVAPALR
jgi:hypothetical protein